jgi:hypothetical protein
LEEPASQQQGRWDSSSALEGGWYSWWVPLIQDQDTDY